MKSVLGGVYDAANPDMGWVGELDAYSTRIVTSAAARFDGTFGRWRSLFDSAERQADEASAQLRRHSLERHERRVLEGIRMNAEKQMELLRGGSDDQHSDFYTYRYLATEGFLPGYNFPRLPLVAFVSTGRGRTQGRTLIQRPRFVGISEFGPNSLVYHEGRAHRVRRVILKGGDQNDAGRLVTATFNVCTACGGAHSGEKPDLCHSCGMSLADADLISDAYRIEQVETVPADRITANDEERRRQGFEIRTVYEWPVRDHGRKDTRAAEVRDDDGLVAKLTFGPATTIRRFNLGLRRRDPNGPDGFNINPRNGYWARSAEEGENEAPDPDKVTPQPIIPYVEDRKNALLFTPAIPLEDTVMADLQYAFIRGLEFIYQLEEGEVLGEALPERADRRSILIYEAAEGGAGVLSQLISDHGALSRVMEKAIEICHFDLPRFKAEGVAATTLHDVDDPKCVAGCYRCLLSYFNQPDHALVDRRKEEFKATLIRIARAQVVRVGQIDAPSVPQDQNAPAEFGQPHAGRDPCPRTPALRCQALRVRWRAVSVYLALRSCDRRAAKNPDPHQAVDFRPRTSGRSLRPERPSLARPDGIAERSPQRRRGMNAPASFSPGNLVKARGREWVVLPGVDPARLNLRPLSGSETDVQALLPDVELEPVVSAVFPPPSASRIGPQDEAMLMRDAFRLALRRGAGPFRGAGRVVFEPKAYQLVPLMMAMKLDTVRLLIADDVGIGKTIEAGLIARELYDRGEIERLTVLCPPHLVDQWVKQLATKFHIPAVAVTASSAARLERNIPQSDSIFRVYPFTVVSLDYIKSDTRRHEFARACPEFVIVDEAHTCVSADEKTHQRYQVLNEIARDPNRHLVLLTATPHSGIADAFHKLLGLLNPDFRRTRGNDGREPRRSEKTSGCTLHPAPAHRHRSMERKRRISQTRRGRANLSAGRGPSGIP